MKRNYLNAEYAQKIADGIRTLIPCNIGIADVEGRVLAGSIHEFSCFQTGALTAVKRKEPYRMDEISDPGQSELYLPIIYHNCIMGAVAVRGDIKKVADMGRVCMSLAALMIENQVLSEQQSARESRLNDFLNDWIGRTEDAYDDMFYQQASFLGIDLKKPRIAVIITGSKIRYDVAKRIKDMLLSEEYMVWNNQEELLLLFHADTNISTRLETIMCAGRELEHCYIGEPDAVTRNTADYAAQTLHVARVLNLKKRFVYRSTVTLECILSHVDVSKEITELADLLKDRDADGVLKNTIVAYMEDNDDYGQICSKLHIHRNTLNYRLAKIEELFNKNPRRARDLMMLYMAVLQSGPV